jgi:serine/threonine protein phosphatase PrpC
MLCSTQRWAAFAMRGQRKWQSDRVFVQDQWNGEDSLIGIIADGHGEDGDEAAEYASRRLPVILSGNGYRHGCPVISLTHACEEIDHALKRRYKGGTTLTMFDRSSDRLIVAHVGDSRAALVTRHHVVELTKDHQDAKGRLTRSLGDRASHVPSTPDVRIIDAVQASRYALLATDEVWRVLDDRLISSRRLAGLLDQPTPVLARDALRRILRDDGNIENASALLLDVS